MHIIIFGVNTYSAFKQQKDLSKVVKPFGVSMEAAFKRVEMIANLVELFTPPHSCKESVSQAHWDNFKEMKKLSENLKRETKYNLLP